MTIDEKHKNKNLQYDINRQTAKESALSSDKIYKYEYITGEEALTSDQSRIKEKAKFNYFPLGKASEKHMKAIQALKLWIGSFRSFKIYYPKISN